MSNQQDLRPNPVLMKRMHPRAKLPRYSTELACAFDLFPVLDCDLPAHAESRQLVLDPGQMASIHLGWAMMPPKDWCIELHSRSGQGKVRVSLANRTGLIDADYTGELIAMVVNEGKEPFTVSEKKAVCQAKLAYSPQADFFEVLVLPTTARGDQGFGHTDAIKQ